MNSNIDNEENKNEGEKTSVKKASNKKSKKNNKKKPKTGLIFWSAFAVIIMICFLIARGRIASVLKETDFFNEVTGSEPALITDLINSQDSEAQSESSSKKENSKKSDSKQKAKDLQKSVKESVNDVKDKKETKKQKKQKEKEQDKKSVTQSISSSDRSESELTERKEIVGKAEKKAEKEVAKENSKENAKEIEKKDSSIDAKTDTKADTKTETKSETKTDGKSESNKSESKTEKTSPSQESAPKQMMSINLCFVQIEDDGSIIRKESIRSVEKNDSPLTTAINALLAGPNMSEIQKGYISIIPQNSRLLGVKISNKTAILNFNEDFTYNAYGVQGQITQLMQIVYTATSFSTIDNVQFLIEGQKLEYIGGEGVLIGSPLSRFSFK